MISPAEAPTLTVCLPQKIGALRCANVYGLQWWGYSCNRRYHSEGAPLPLVVGRFIRMFDDLPLCRWVVGAPRVLACWVPWISGEAWRMLQDV